MRAARGFTLIEVMITIAIIALLAAIAIPVYQNYLIRTQISEGISLSSGAQKAVAEFIAESGHLPPGNLSAGLPTNTSIAGQYVSSVTVVSGQVQVAFNGVHANSNLSGKLLVFSPNSTAGAVSWACNTSQTSISNLYLPATCRH